MWVDGSYGYIQCNVWPPKAGYTILRLFPPVRLQHLRDITGHRSLHQRALLLGINRFAELLTSVFPRTLWRPRFSVWQYMEFVVQAQGDCRANWNAEWQGPVRLRSEWPKSDINKMHPCQEGHAPFIPIYPLGKVSAFAKPQKCLVFHPCHFLGFTQALAILAGYNGSYIPLGRDTGISHTCLTVTCEV